MNKNILTRLNNPKMTHRFRNRELALADCDIVKITPVINAVNIDAVCKDADPINVIIILYNTGIVKKPYKSCSERCVSRWKSVIAPGGMIIVKPNLHLACNNKQGFYLEVDNKRYGCANPYPGVYMSIAHCYFP